MVELGGVRVPTFCNRVVILSKGYHRYLALCLTMYTCLECKFKTKAKSDMDKHVQSLQVSVDWKQLSSLAHYVSMIFCKQMFTMLMSSHNKTNNLNLKN